jgi:hypothetical protein
MKKTVLLSILICTTSFLYGQLNYEWQIKDSLKLTKAEIYSSTKQFIGINWKSSKDVIQNDDQEGGVILLKGLTIPIQFVQAGATYSYTYSYDVTFKMKDGKYFLTINNVKCHSTVGSSFDNKFFIEPHENANCEYSTKKFGEKCNYLMSELKLQLQNMADSYVKFLNSETSSGGDW